MKKTAFIFLFEEKWLHFLYVMIEENYRQCSRGANNVKGHRVQLLSRILVRFLVLLLFCHYMTVEGDKKATGECIPSFCRRQMDWERRALWLERTSWLFTCWRGWIDRARVHTLPSCTSYETGQIIVMQTLTNRREGCPPNAVCLSTLTGPYCRGVSLIKHWREPDKVSTWSDYCFGSSVHKLQLRPVLCTF